MITLLFDRIIQMRETVLQEFFWRVIQSQQTADNIAVCVITLSMLQRKKHVITIIIALYRKTILTNASTPKHSSFYFVRRSS